MALRRGLLKWYIEKILRHPHCRRCHEERVIREGGGDARVFTGRCIYVAGCMDVG